MDFIQNIDDSLTEHRFWLQIMGDHSRFIFYSLAPTESEYILIAQNFIIQFDQLLELSQSLLSFAEFEELTRRSFETVNRLREYKIELLDMSIASDLKSHLSSTFYNDMLNELDQYLYIINALMHGYQPLQNPLHYHMLWLNDAVGHAGFLKSGLDLIEKDLINQADCYEQLFQELNFKSFTMNGYLRTGINNFASLDRLNEEVQTAMRDFMEFLESIREGRMDHKIVGTLMPLMLDHMLREECYYLHKLSQSAENIRQPDCDPTSPRLDH